MEEAWLLGGAWLAWRPRAGPGSVGQSRDGGGSGAAQRAARCGARAAWAAVARVPALPG